MTLFRCLFKHPTVIFTAHHRTFAEYHVVLVVSGVLHAQLIQFHFLFVHASTELTHLQVELREGRHKKGREVSLNEVYLVDYFSKLCLHGGELLFTLDDFLVFEINFLGSVVLLLSGLRDDSLQLQA